MVNALKRLDKKFLVFVGLVIFLPIFIIVFLVIIQGCGNTKISPEKYEKKMISALEKYIKAEKKIPTKEGQVLTLELDSLVNKGYIKSTGKLLGDDSCKGSVSVRRNGASIEANQGGYLNYTVNLECEDYSTTHIVDKLKESIVTEESGLYQDGEGYVFKGHKVKNNIVFSDRNYKIMSIDKDGILKLVKAEPESIDRIWDNKYNVETNRSNGINVYKDSLIADYLLNDYLNVKKFNTKLKTKIIAYDACIGKRSAQDNSINSELDCSEILPKQVVSLLSASDYAKASLDTNCTSLRTLSCNNFNYLYGVASSTWTLNGSSDNSYQVAFLSDGLVEYVNANELMTYNIVIYVDGNMLYVDGDGSSNNPYVVE